MHNHNSAVDSILARPVKQLLRRDPFFVDPAASVAEAARAMQAAGIGSVLIASDPPGIVTDRDLRGRVLAAGREPQTAVSQIMSSPLITLPGTATAFAALRLILEHNIHHLPIVEEKKIIGVLSATDLLFSQSKSPIYLRGFVETVQESADAAAYGAQLGELVDALFQSGLAAIQISQLVSALNDALVKRLVRLAVAKLGAPPTSFAWIVFGSEGRLEQTLLTDQDNALIYGADSEDAQAYFASLARQVVDGLIGAGFPPCAGGFMATRWCKPLASWEQLFTQWIRVPEPQALLDAAIFFDYRGVAGDLSLESLAEIVAGAGSQRSFLSHLARGAMDFFPPLGFFNRLRSENGAVDLKKSGIAPIVGLARVAALATGSRERSTLGRLSAARSSAAPFSGDDATSLGEIFRFLFQLRLQGQLQARRAGRPIDHRVHLASLSSATRRQLKDALVAIKRIQIAIRAAWNLDALA